MAAGVGHQPAREPDADDLRALIPQRNALVILGLQRSGTALLASDITGLRVLGKPGEHLIRVGAQGLPTWDQAREFATLGSHADSDTFAVTLMVNYIEIFGRWVAPRSPGVKIKRMQLEDLAIRFFLDRFDRVTFVTLRREPLWEMAYSHWRVTQTNQYHRRGDSIALGARNVTWQNGDLLEPDPAAILGFVDDIMTKQARLDAIIERHQIAPVALTYREVVDSFPAYLERLTAAAQVEGPSLSHLRREMTKLTPQAEIAAAHTALRRFLGRDP